MKDRFMASVKKLVKEREERRKAALRAAKREGKEFFGKPMKRVVPIPKSVYMLPKGKSIGRKLTREDKCVRGSSKNFYQNPLVLGELT